MTAPATLISGNFYNSDNVIRLSQNGARGKGGICYGDSGGPDLVGNTRVAIAVNSYVTNTGCFGVAYTTRLDRTPILSWISEFFN